MAIIKFKINQEEHYIEWWWIQNDTTGTTDVIEKIWSGTKSEYDLLWTYDPDTYYIITDEWEWREYIISNTTGTTQKITNIRKGTQAEYDLLGTYDSKCYYIISDRAEPIVNNRTGTTWIVESIWYGTKAEFDLLATKDEKCIYVVDTPPPVFDTPWVYHNATLWLISASSDWINWITIASSMLPWLYQFWNNQEFPRGTASAYTQPFDPDGWGGVTDTLVARQWPCSSWFHVPTKAEAEFFKSAVDNWDWYTYFGSVDGVDYPDLSFYYGSFWTSDTTWTRPYAMLEEDVSEIGAESYSLPILPFPNAPVIPDDTWTVLYQPTP